MHKLASRRRNVSSLVRLLAAAFALTALVACTDRIAANNYHLTDVAVSLRHRLVFVGAPTTGDVQVLRLDPKSLPHQMTYVGHLSEPERANVLRIAVDDERSRVWVLAPTAAYLYDLRDLHLLRRYDRQGTDDYERFGDLALDGNGDVYVLSRGGARILRIRSDAAALEPWLDAFNGTRTAALYLSNRLAVDDEGRGLVTISPVDGQLVRIDLASKRAIVLRQNGNPDFTCGIPFWSDARGTSAERSLVMLDCAGNWIADAKLGGEAANVVVAGETRPHDGEPVVGFRCARPSLSSC